MTDTHGQLSTNEIDRLEDVEIWVLLLNGPSEIYKVEFASALGIVTAHVSQMNVGSTLSSKGTALRLRLHPIPFYVARRHVLIMNADYLAKSYKAECLDEMVYGAMINRKDQDLWDRCKAT